MWARSYEVLDQPIPPRRHSHLRTRVAPDAAGAETSHFFSPNHASRVRKPPDRMIPRNSSPLSACHSSAPFTPLVPSQHQFFRSTALFARAAPTRSSAPDPYPTESRSVASVSSRKWRNTSRSSATTVMAFPHLSGAWSARGPKPPRPWSSSTRSFQL